MFVPRVMMGGAACTVVVVAFWTGICVDIICGTDVGSFSIWTALDVCEGCTLFSDSVWPGPGLEEMPSGADIAG